MSMMGTRVLFMEHSLQCEVSAGPNWGLEYYKSNITKYWTIYHFKLVTGVTSTFYISVKKCLLFWPVEDIFGKNL